MRSTAARLSLFIAATCSMLGVHLPFWPKWLEARGLTKIQIGVVGTAWAWSRCVASPTWAHFVDQSGRRRGWIQAFALASLALFAPFVLLDDFDSLVGLTIVFCIAHAALLPLGENLIVLNAREHGIAYGRVRVWGSVAFVVASWIAGAALDGGNEERAYALVMACLAAGAAASFWLPAESRSAPPPRQGIPIRRVLSDRRVLAVLAGAGILQAGHATYYVFASLHWSAAGHSTTTISALWSEGVIAESLLFAFSQRLAARWHDRGLVLAAVVGSLVRWSVLATTTSLPWLFGVQWMHGLTFAAAHVGVMAFLSRAVPREFSATAQSVYGTMNIAAHALTLMLVTPIFDRAAGAAFWPGIPIAVLGGAITMWGMAERRDSMPAPAE